MEANAAAAAETWPPGPAVLRPALRVAIVLMRLSLPLSLSPRVCLLSGSAVVLLRQCASFALIPAFPSLLPRCRTFLT